MWESPTSLHFYGGTDKYKLIHGVDWMELDTSIFIPFKYNVKNAKIEMH